MLDELGQESDQQLSANARRRQIALILQILVLLMTIAVFAGGILLILQQL